MIAQRKEGLGTGMPLPVHQDSCYDDLVFQVIAEIIISTRSSLIKQAKREQEQDLRMSLL